MLYNRTTIVTVAALIAVAAAKKSPVEFTSRVNVDGSTTGRSVNYNLRKASPEIYSETALNVHIVPHTHDDVGWLKTVDQYFYGANNTIQHAGVQYIISSVVAALEANPARTFTYVEMAFFARWFYEQTEDMQGRVRALVAGGQLSFANGGWCMHDEAAAHYISMIDQTTLGHAFLAKEFDYQPRVGWQVDPFGHSSTQASLLSWAAGFDALYFGRIDYQDRQQRQATQECEGVWRSSESMGPDAQVFWSLTGEYGGNYYGPSGFDWDVGNINAVPWMDDENLHDYNIAPLVEEFTQSCLNQGVQTKGRHIMMTMGGDFQYESAPQQFTNLDKIIHYVNEAHGDEVNLFYSNPTIFADAKHAEGTAWSVKTVREGERGTCYEPLPFFKTAGTRPAARTTFFLTRTATTLIGRGTSRAGPSSSASSGMPRAGSRRRVSSRCTPARGRLLERRRPWRTWRQRRG